MYGMVLLGEASRSDNDRSSCEEDTNMVDFHTVRESSEKLELGAHVKANFSR